MNHFTVNNGLCDMTLMYSKNKKKFHLTSMNFAFRTVGDLWLDVKIFYLGLGGEDSPNNKHLHGCGSVSFRPGVFELD